MPPDPIDVTKRGNSVILVGQRPDGKFIPVQVDNDGNVMTTGGGGGGGSAVDQGAPGPNAWLMEVAHPIENDGSQDYVVVREKFSEATRDAVVELNNKTPPRAATTVTIERGTANTTSGTLPSGSFPDGFTVANLSTDTIIYWHPGTASDTTGYPIFPETEEEFENADPSAIAVATAAGSAAWALKGWS